MFNHFIDEKSLTNEELTSKIEELQRKMIVAYQINSSAVDHIRIILEQLINERIERFDMALFEHEEKDKSDSVIIGEEST